MSESMSETCWRVWASKTGRTSAVPTKLCSLPPTSEPFKENVKKGPSPSNHVAFTGRQQSAWTWCRNVQMGERLKTENATTGSPSHKCWTCPRDSYAYDQMRMQEWKFLQNTFLQLQKGRFELHNILCVLCWRLQQDSNLAFLFNWLDNTTDVWTPLINTLSMKHIMNGYTQILKF